MKWWLWFGIFFGADQITKWWFDPVVHNAGGIWGVGKGWPWELLMVGSLLAVLIWLVRTRDGMEKLGLVMLISAGMSNYMDRLVFGGVRDFIWWPGLNVYGNVADTLIVISVFILGLIYITGKRRA